MRQKIPCCSKIVPLVGPRASVVPDVSHLRCHSFNPLRSTNWSGYIIICPKFIDICFLFILQSILTTLRRFRINTFCSSIFSYWSQIFFKLFRIHFVIAIRINICIHLFKSFNNLKSNIVCSVKSIALKLNQTSISLILSFFHPNNCLQFFIWLFKFNDFISLLFMNLFTYFIQLFILFV